MCHLVGRISVKKGVKKSENDASSHSTVKDNTSSHTSFKDVTTKPTRREKAAERMRRCVTMRCPQVKLT